MLFSPLWELTRLPKAEIYVSTSREGEREGKGKERRGKEKK